MQSETAHQLLRRQREVAFEHLGPAAFQFAFQPFGIVGFDPLDGMDPSEHSLRLFGGAQFRVADSERDSAPKLLKVNFNDDVGIMGGVGFNIRKFFFDFRLSGYARSHVWNTFVSDGVSQRVRIPRNLVYGGSVGFFF